MYHLATDPLEMNNLFHKEGLQSEIQRLKEELVYWVGKVNGIE